MHTRYALLKMKFIILCNIFFFNSVVAAGQEEVPKTTIANHFQLFEYSQSNLNSLNRDTLDKTVRILQNLYRFDSLLYSLNTLYPLLDSVENSYKKSLKASLIGTWVKKWDLLDILMCGDIVSYKGNQIVRVTEDSIFIHSGKRLIAKYNYTIMHKQSFYYFSLGFELSLNDKSKFWPLRLSTNSPVFPEKNKTPSLYLLIQSVPATPDVRHWEVYVKLSKSSLL